MGSLLAGSQSPLQNPTYFLLFLSLLLISEGLGVC